MTRRGAHNIINGLLSYYSMTLLVLPKIKIRTMSLSSHSLSSLHFALTESRVSTPKLKFLISSKLPILGSLPLLYGSFRADCSKACWKIRGNSSKSCINSADTLGSSPLTDEDTVPMPIVLIDQDSDSSATIVQLGFGDRLGGLIDTMKALRDLGLDVTKGSVTSGEGAMKTKFFITNMGRKVEDPDMLERIRLTIINNLLKYHPECSEKLAMGEAFGIKAPEKKLDINIATHIVVKDDGPKRSLLCIETADRPGLLLEVIKILADINVDVESAEIDTEGLVAKDKFHVSYRGAALSDSLSQVLVNCLRYYFRRPETDEDSY